MVLKRIGRGLGLGKNKKLSEEVAEVQRRQEEQKRLDEERKQREQTSSWNLPSTDMPLTAEAPMEPPTTVATQSAPSAEAIIETAPQPQGEPEAAPAPAAPSQETYVVQSGDTLSAIAQRFYGDANAYMRIFESNRDKLDNPDLIQPGQELVIPR
jgi:nucleoid-associated protein YgaU